ncbi:MAG: hypothetical protein H0X47_17400 [Nitrospirales bacterium]|nr:hypothetical protein [Nitrospirales bacterium]
MTSLAYSSYWSLGPHRAIYRCALILRRGETLTGGPSGDSSTAPRLSEQGRVAVSRGGRENPMNGRT